MDYHMDCHKGYDSSNCEEVHENESKESDRTRSRVGVNCKT